MMKPVSTAFILISIVSMAGFGFLVMNSQNNMPGCIFTGHTMLCTMNVVEHISLWQSMLVATPHKASILVLLLVLVFAVGLPIFRKYLSHFLRSGPSFLKQLLHRQPNTIFFDCIKYAFAKGILHPRIYEPARL